MSIARKDAREIALRFDTSTFPIVWLHADDEFPDDEVRDFAKFERLLHRGEALVFITDHAFCTYDCADVSLARRKVEWLRRYRPRLQRQVKALIQIEPDTGKRGSALGFVHLFYTFWGYPLVIVEDESSAIGLALELLTVKGSMSEYKRCLH